MTVVVPTLAQAQGLPGGCWEWDQEAARQVREDSGGLDLGKVPDCQTQKDITAAH